MSEALHNADAAELARFGALASRWWDANGPQKGLHAINPARLAFITERCPLNGKQVVDVGCGAGLLSEAMAAQGAEVIGLDLSPQVIDVAKLHLLESGLRVDYRLQSAETLADARPASCDVVTCMEMLEHVPDPDAVVGACAKLLKPGGHLFLSTLNRTPASFALAIVGAEYLAGIVPKGTHEYAKFIKPSELSACLRGHGFEVRDVRGLRYDPLRNAASVVDGVQVNYLMHAVKR